MLKVHIWGCIASLKSFSKCGPRKIARSRIKYGGMLDPSGPRPKSHPGHLQFMIVSPHDVTDNKPELLVNDVLKPETSVKVTGVIIDNRENFSQHVSNLYTKAARQFNALARISRYIDEASINMIYNSVVRSDFNFCPMVWHFCWIQNKEEDPRIVYGYYSSLHMTNCYPPLKLLH